MNITTKSIAGITAQVSAVAESGTIYADVTIEGNSLTEVKNGMIVATTTSTTTDRETGEEKQTEQTTQLCSFFQQGSVMQVTFITEDSTLRTAALGDIADFIADCRTQEAALCEVGETKAVVD